MRYTFFELVEHSGVWVAEAIDVANDGAIHRATFEGPAARDRVEEYVELKNRTVGTTCHAIQESGPTQVFVRDESGRGEGIFSGDTKEREAT